MEPRWLQVVRREMPIRALPAHLTGELIVHITDTHVGPDVPDDYVLDVFRVVAELNPAIVVFTGDLTTHHPGVIEQAKRVYSDLPHGRLGTIGVLGNHDYGAGWSDYEHADQVSAALSGSGIDLLCNETRVVGGVQVVGFGDLWAGRFDPRKALRGVDEARPMIGLSHNPDSVDADGWDGFEGWILSGHTHGGQIRLPFLPPPHVPVRNRRYTAGELELSGGRRLYVGRGVGYSRVRARFNVRPEVTVFEMLPA